MGLLGPVGSSAGSAAVKTVPCPRCGEETPERFNFCVSCRHRIRDLRGIRIGAGVNQRTAEKIEYMLETGDPSVFGKKG